MPKGDGHNNVANSAAEEELVFQTTIPCDFGQRVSVIRFNGNALARNDVANFNRQAGQKLPRLCKGDCLADKIPFLIGSHSQECTKAVLVQAFLVKDAIAGTAFRNFSVHHKKRLGEFWPHPDFQFAGPRF